jgi:hypothetical protein
MTKRNLSVVFVFLTLLSVSVFLIFESGRVRENKEGNNTSLGTKSQPTEAMHRQTVVNDMNVVYYVLSENNLEKARTSYPDSAVFEKGYSYDLIPFVNMCRIVVSEESLTSENTVQGILESLASCYADITLGFSNSDSPDKDSFVDEWVRIYTESCGSHLQPLGVPVTDGTCERVPHFNEVSL